jgi:hypothetical protein
MSVLGRYPIFQHAYVVADIEEAVVHWSEVFGAGPFVIVAHHRTDWFEYRGTPLEADVSYAFGYLGELQIQFVQQHDDTPSIYREMYDPGEEGPHHVGLLVQDYAAERRRLVDLGFEVACELRHGAVEAGYLDTRSLTGGFTELHTDPPLTLQSFAIQRRAHQLHRPGDDPVLQRR